MKGKTSPCRISEGELEEIVQRYNKNVLIKSDAYPDAGTEPLWGRFHRSVLNQIDNGEATISRYAIWANTVRDNIVEGLESMESGEIEKARFHLVRAANSLSAFTDVQAFFDSLNEGNLR